MQLATRVNSTRFSSVLGLCLAMTSCRGDHGSPAANHATAAPTPAALEPVIAAGIAFVRRDAFDDPFEELFLGLAARRFARRDAEGALARFRLTDLAEPQPDRRLLGRWLDPTVAYDEQALTSIDRMNSNRAIVEAMYCGSHPLGSSHADYANAAAAMGGYELTHVLAAYAIARDTGCAYPVVIDSVSAWQAEASRLIGLDGATDLQMEAALVLLWSGRRDLVPVDFVNRVVSAQWRSGGWSLHEGDRSPSAHATFLAVLFLLEWTQEPLGPLVPPAR